MSLNRESEVFLRYAQKYISGRANIAQGLQEARRRPEVIEGTIQGIDRAVVSLNRFIKAPDEVVQSQGTLVPNALLIQEKFGGTTFPKATELANNRSFDVIRLGMRAFKEGNKLMERGEAREITNAWEFHKTIKDPGQLADLLGLELYRLFTQPDLAMYNLELMLALEEMLAVHHQDTRMFQSIKKFYSKEEGFLPLLVAMVRGEVGIPFQEGQILRQTPNFQVVDGYKPGLEGERFIIEPLTDRGEELLGLAAIEHNATQSVSLRSVKVSGTARVRFTLRADRTADNIRVLLGDFIDIPKPGAGSIPSPGRMEEILGLQHPFYTFTD